MLLSRERSPGATILSRGPVKIPMEAERFRIEGVGEWDIFVPATVYPPREDTLMLCHVVSELVSESGSKAIEIGCGSGLVSMVLATLGWDVEACDVNPYAVACTRGNMEANGLSGKASIIEAEIGDNLQIPEDAELVVWNLPYLEKDEGNSGMLERIEDAALTDIPDGGWGRVLLQTLEENSTRMTENVMVILVMRTEPEGNSRIADWERNGWSWRTLRMGRYGTEKIEVVGLWRTGSGIDAKVIDSCTSTMDEASILPNGGWQRVVSRSQKKGRGRRGSDWISEEGGLFATWNLDPRLLKEFSPGIVQTSIGSVVSKVLGAYMKWPNDIVDEKGRKVGGVLVESTNNGTIRVGVGANRSSFDEGGISAAGWDGTIGDVHSSEVFLRLDREISSVFEAKEMISIPGVDFLSQLSWKTLSRLLSRGVLATQDGELYRPTGMKETGELELAGIVDDTEFIELDGIGWIYP